jgi:hypothetical protein
VKVAVAAHAGHATSGRETSSYGAGRLLAELESLLRLNSRETYDPWPDAASEIIGRHVDRCLDLLEAFLRARAAGVIVYGLRARAAGTQAARLERVQALRALSTGRAVCSLDRVICVVHETGLLDRGDRAWSTLGNELAFVVNGVVDSQRAIERLMTSREFPVPPGFGSMELRPLRARSLVPLP